MFVVAILMKKKKSLNFRKIRYSIRLAVLEEYVWEIKIKDKNQICLGGGKDIKCRLPI